MQPWDTLGIEATEDERAIKRAYSKLLLVHRPDEDPAGFQRLREAYDLALKLARNKSQAAARRKLEFNKVILASVPMPPAPPPPKPHAPSGTAPPAPATEAPAPTPAPEAAPRPVAAPAPEAPAAPAERRRSASEVTEHLIASAARLRDDPAGYTALLAEEPELFNLDTKLAVSVLLARALTKGADFPHSLMPVAAKFFEWDTFAEQRRLGAAGMDGKRLYTLLAGLELQNYLAAAAPKKSDQARTRRWLKRLKRYNATPARWTFGLLSLFWRKHIIFALNQAVGHFGHPALEQYLGPKSYRYWLQLYSNVPTLTQAATQLGRIAVLGGIGTLFTLILATRWGEDQVWVGMIAFTAWAGEMPLAWYLVVWVLKAVNYGIARVLFPFMGRQIGKLGLGAKFRRHVGSRLGWMVLNGRPRAQLALAVVFGAAAIFWPVRLSSGWYALAALPVLLLSRPEPPEFIAFFVLSLVSTILGGMTGWGGHLVTLSWPLSCLYVMWGGRALHRWLQPRLKFERPTAPGMVLIGSGLVFLATLIGGSLVGR